MSHTVPHCECYGKHISESDSLIRSARWSQMFLIVSALQKQGISDCEKLKGIRKIHGPRSNEISDIQI